MGMFATLKGDKFAKCPKCGVRADWQSKGLWLTYKGREIWIGHEGNIELDENMNGHIVCWGFPKELTFKDGTKGCGHVTYHKIVKGETIESTEEEYRHGEQT
ncbi:MAG: hypothetical protein KJI69_04990 [Patescibacteria group bacterium]|nr:hypothetical protein [Patescibacteria group bacterium]